MPKENAPLQIEIPSQKKRQLKVIAFNRETTVKALLEEKIDEIIAESESKPRTEAAA